MLYLLQIIYINIVISTEFEHGRKFFTKFGSMSNFTGIVLTIKLQNCSTLKSVAYEIAQWEFRATKTTN